MIKYTDVQKTGLDTKISASWLLEWRNRGWSHLNIVDCKVVILQPSSMKMNTTFCSASCQKVRICFQKYVMLHFSY